VQKKSTGLLSIASSQRENKKKEKRKRKKSWLKTKEKKRKVSFLVRVFLASNFVI
jgi:hypothetical protein